MDDDARHSSSDDSSEPQTHNMTQTSATEQLSPTTTNRAPTSRHPPPNQITASPSETQAFLASLTAHYAARSDVVTPHIFTQHCKDYHTGKSDENAFYVSVYRLFCATDARHLMQGFRAFLPSAWMNIELGWLDRAVEEDVEKQARESRELTRSLVALLEGVGGGVSVRARGEGALLGDDDDDAAATTKKHADALVELPVVKKRKTPINAFRATTSRIGSRLVDSGATSPEPTPPELTPPHPGDQTEVQAEMPVIKKRGNIMNVFRSSPKIPSRLAQSSTTSPESTPAPTRKSTRSPPAQEQEREKEQDEYEDEDEVEVEEQTTTPPRPTDTPLGTSPPALKPTPLDRPSVFKASLSPIPRSSSPSKSKSKSPAPNPRSSTPTGPIPSASQIPHLGPIYRDKRTILSRPATKPYIHALCGDRFGHPAEVQRHHNGQSGRPGCWAKKGKPEGEEGTWDAHVSCKVRLTDLNYVKVKEGFVVTSWGDVRGVEGLREGEGDVDGDEGVGGEDGGGENGSGDGTGGDVVESGEKRKRPVVKLKIRRQIKSDTDVGGGDSDGGLKEFVDAQSSPEPAEKRQKIADTEEDIATPMDIDAAQSSPDQPAEQPQKSSDTGVDTTASLAANAAAARAVVFGLRARK